MGRQEEHQKEINLGDIVTVSDILRPGIVTRILDRYEVEVYWSEEFPQEREYISQLQLALE